MQARWRDLGMALPRQVRLSCRAQADFRESCGCSSALLAWRPRAQSGGSRVIRPQRRGQQRPVPRAAGPRPPAPVPPQVPSGQSVRPKPPVHRPRPPGGRAQSQAASVEEPGPDVLRPQSPPVRLGVSAPAAGAAPASVHHELSVQPRDLSPARPRPGSAFPRAAATPSHAPQQSVQLTVQSPCPGASRHNQLEGLLPVLVKNKKFL